MSDSDQVVHAPKSSADMAVEQLAYVESFDAVVDKDYAYVVYKETKTGTGKSVIRIKGSVTAGTVFDPESSALKGSLKKAAGHDEPYLVWGFNLQPSENDPRLVENRVVLDSDGKPSTLEVHLITRKADQSPRDKKMVSVPWPQSE
ncbi:MAG: hypothetical protein GY926_27370 [bacterium]|nr:hypothetical protein [bacterium]